MTTKDMITALRALGYSQVQIATETGITQATISRLETGVHADTSYDKAKRIESMLQKAQAVDGRQVANS